MACLPQHPTKPDQNPLMCTKSTFMTVDSKDSRCETTGLRGFPTRSDTNRAVQSLNMARGLKFLDLDRSGIVLSL